MKKSDCKQTSGFYRRLALFSEFRYSLDLDIVRNIVST